MASATGTKRWVEKCAAASLLVVGCSGSRSCAEEKGADAAADARFAQPTMPTGMLMPAVTAGASVGAEAGVVRARKGGAWVELQVARAGDDADRREFTRWSDDSWFVSLEAMTRLHEPFAKALPGFDLFLPRLFAPDALAKLGDELEALALARSTSGDTATARTAGDLAPIVRSAAAKKQSLWVLGPS